MPSVSHPVRIYTADGWQDLAVKGPPGIPGVNGVVQDLVEVANTVVTVDPTIHTYRLILDGNIATGGTNRKITARPDGRTATTTAQSTGLYNIGAGPVADTIPATISNIGLLVGFSHGTAANCGILFDGLVNARGVGGNRAFLQGAFTVNDQVGGSPIMGGPYQVSSWIDQTTGSSFNTITFDFGGGTFTGRLVMVPTELSGPQGAIGPPGPSVGLPMDTWHAVGPQGGAEPAFQNSWVNRPGGYVMSFRKYLDGSVRVRGSVGIGASGTAIFTLPAGYRPQADTYFAAIGTAVPLASAGHFLYVSATSGSLFGYRSGTNDIIFDFTFDTDSVSSMLGAGPPLVSALPASPDDGQECYFQTAAMATNGIVWHLRYRAASASAYKWEVLGAPPPLYAEDVTQITITSSSYIDTTPLVSIGSLPLAGDYIIEHGSQLWHSTSGNFTQQSPYIGVTAIDNDWVYYTTTGANYVSTAARKLRRNSLASGITIKLQAKTSAATGTLRGRWLSVTPIRVG